MFDEFVHVNNVFLSPDVAGFIVHGQDAAEAFSMAPAQVEIAHRPFPLSPFLFLSHIAFICGKSIQRSEGGFRGKRAGKPEFRAIAALYELVVTTPLSQLVELQ